MDSRNATETSDLDPQGPPPQQSDPPAVHGSSRSSLNAVTPDSADAMDVTPLPIDSVSWIPNQSFTFAAPHPTTPATASTSAIRKSSRLKAIKRRHSALDIPAVPMAGSKRERADEPGSSKVRVVESAMAQRLQAEISGKEGAFKELEQTLRGVEHGRQQAIGENRQLKERIDTLLKKHVELEHACLESSQALENLKTAHRSELEAVRVNAMEEMSVRNSLDLVENSAPYKALDTRFQTVSQSLADHEAMIRRATDALTAKDAEIKEHQSTNSRLLGEQSCLELELSEARSAQRDAAELRKETVSQLNLQIQENKDTKDLLRQAKENLGNVLRSLHTTEQTVRAAQTAEEEYKSKVAEQNRIIESKNAEHARLVSLTDSLKENLERTSKLLEQKGIALEAQGGFKEQLDASRRELSTANTKVAELTQKVNDLQQATRTMQNEHSSEISTLTARLTDSRNAADKTAHEHQAQRREMLAEKNKASEIEREARRVKDVLLKEMQITINEAREENQVLKERIDGLELENKKLGKRRADEPAGIEASQSSRIRNNETLEENERLKERIATLELENKRLGKRRADEPADTATTFLDANEKHDMRRRSGTPSLSVFSIVSARRPEPQHPQAIEQDPSEVVMEETVGNVSDSRSDLHQRRRPLPSVRDAHQAREVSPEIAAPETYHTLPGSKHSARGASSTHPATPVRRSSQPGVQHPEYRISPSPGPPSGPSNRQPFTPDQLRTPSPTIRRSGTPTTPQLYNSDNTTFSQADVQDLVMGILQAVKTKKPRYSVTPFKPQASPRPRTVEHNNVMAQTRMFLSKLLEIKTDADMASLDISHVANPRDVDDFEKGRIQGVFLQPLQICWDIVNCKWNMYLGELFAKSLIRSNPSLEGQDEAIFDHFLKRIATLRAVFLKSLPRQGETSEESQIRVSLDHQRSLHEKRIRSRQIELKGRRFNDCAAGSSTEDEELATLVGLLGDDGISSDESDGRGNRIVRDKLWRNRAIINRMARADSKHKATGPYGNRKAGAQLQRRIRRQHGPISRKKVPTRKPINYYDTAFYHSLSPLERAKLDAQPPVPFRGEFDHVDEDLFD